MEVPWRNLSEGALRGVIEDFITREGTDYGEHTFTLDEKVDHVKAQLKRNECFVDFDPESETVSLVARRR